MLESLFEGRWVDHHYGFHLLLAPFVLALGGVVGGKVYAAFAGAAATWALALWFRRERVPHALAFALLPLALSWGYAFRLGMVRAMSLSQVFLVLTLFLALHGRNRALALVTALYALSYQLAVLALPISVGALVFDRILGKKEPSTSPQEATRPNLWTPVAALVGLAVGLLIHPNAPHTLDFLTEHAATGLGSVGAPFTNEWKAPGSGVVWMQGLGLLLLLGGAGAALARKAVASRRLRPDTALLCCGALCGTALMLLSMRRRKCQRRNVVATSRRIRVPSRI